MKPIAPLMIEHRLIERMIAVMKEETNYIRRTRRVDSAFINVIVDFIRTYTDLCHHGKEEHILFQDLEGRDLSKEHRKMLGELLYEHSWARERVGHLVEANNSYGSGDVDALDDIVRILGELIDFYPKHIEKEDKHFFGPCLSYFSSSEQDEMSRRFSEFDQQIIHDRYKTVTEKLEDHVKQETRSESISFPI
jgi:hemerythrin-like domain-containing protein